MELNPFTIMRSVKKVVEIGKQALIPIYQLWLRVHAMSTKYSNREQIIQVGAEGDSEMKTRQFQNAEQFLSDEQFLID